MKDFPEFLNNPVNEVAAASQFSKDIAGYVFDGADGSQVIFWTYRGVGQVANHAHEYDEYLLVIEGQYTLIIDGKRIPVNAGEEYLIKRGVLHGGDALAGTRTIDVFGGKRAKRTGEN
jgi:quercetin dioxygenase-like cupin family protein